MRRAELASLGLNWQRLWPLAAQTTSFAMQGTTLQGSPKCPYKTHSQLAFWQVPKEASRLMMGHRQHLPMAGPG